MSEGGINAATELKVYGEQGVGVDEVNSYVDDTEFDQYIEDNNYTLADTVQTGDKERALKQALVMLDGIGRGQRQWIGDRASAEQMQAWPRDNAVFEGKTLSNVLVPTQIKNAQCELAYQILKGDLSQNDEVEGNIKKEKVGPIETEFSTPFQLPKTRADSFTYVKDLVSGFLRPVASQSDASGQYVSYRAVNLTP